MKDTLQDELRQKRNALHSLWSSHKNRVQLKKDVDRLADTVFFMQHINELNNMFDNQSLLQCIAANDFQLYEKDLDALMNLYDQMKESSQVII